MAITVNLRYTGKNRNALKYAEEMTGSGTVAAIRTEKGNLRYEYTNAAYLKEKKTWIKVKKN